MQPVWEGNRGVAESNGSLQLGFFLLISPASWLSWDWDQSGPYKCKLSVWDILIKTINNYNKLKQITFVCIHIYIPVHNAYNMCKH